MEHQWTRSCAVVLTVNGSSMYVFRNSHMNRSRSGCSKAYYWGRIGRRTNRRIEARTGKRTIKQDIKTSRCPCTSTKPSTTYKFNNNYWPSIFATAFSAKWNSPLPSRVLSSVGRDAWYPFPREKLPATPWAIHWLWAPNRKWHLSASEAPNRKFWYSERKCQWAWVYVETSASDIWHLIYDILVSPRTALSRPACIRVSQRLGQALIDHVTTSVWSSDINALCTLRLY